MMISFSILISLLLGLLSCNLIFREVKSISFRFLFNLAFPIGIAFSSIIFLFFNVLGFSSILTLSIEIILIILLILRIKDLKNEISHYEWFSLKRLMNSPILLLTFALYFYSLILDAGIFYFDSIKEPHGLWDAWSDWNLGTRMISRDPQGWTSTFPQMLSEDFHTCDPLLQKGFIARCWVLAENETVWVPIVFCFIITFCSIGLVSSAISVFTSKTEGLLAGLVLLCTPFFMVMGDSQYADSTVGYFFLATIILLTFARKEPVIQPKLLIAAGITAGLAAFTKNEGLLFVVCIVASQLTLVFFKNIRDLIAELKYIILGMLPGLLLLTYQKIMISPPNHLVGAQGASSIPRLMDISRYQIVGNWYLEQFGTFGHWALNPWWLFLLGIIFKGGISIKKYNYSFIPHITWLLLMLMGGFMVEIMAPLDLIYYLSTSVHRLLFQLFPAFIFIYFIALKNNPAKSSRSTSRIN